VQILRQSLLVKRPSRRPPHNMIQTVSNRLHGFLLSLCLVRDEMESARGTVREGGARQRESACVFQCFGVESNESRPFISGARRHSRQPLSLSNSLSLTHKIQHSAFLSHSSGLQHGSSFSLQALLAQIFRQNKYHRPLFTQPSKHRLVGNCEGLTKVQPRCLFFFGERRRRRRKSGNLRKDTKKFLRFASSFFSEKKKNF